MFCLFGLSCNLTERVEQLKKISADLKSTFKHEHVATEMDWDTSQGGKSVTTLFYDFNLNSYSHSSLDSLAVQISNRIRSQNPDLAEFDYIEIRFTVDKNPKSENIIKFRYKAK